MTTASYPHLLAPLDLGFVTLPNRCLMGSMQHRARRAPRRFRAHGRPTSPSAPGAAWA
ncbi:hypothetical protein [Pseudomonas sp. KNUC1026]|uniref:hypothetical protein n=1 Tax=Pseudomonas sp. KNUC1026 TaxID=2893890 RepID=UPI001F3035F5|nr:hypothetical protein [Pseudomonas sp. KNUC1026]UFH50581.1 hypothetical protein LN139_05045 [Pseudomonas sp. KNUC1026]